MDEETSGANLPLVTDSERGQRIQERLDALRMSDRQFHAKTGVSRGSLRKAVAGDPTVKGTTVDAIEMHLDRLEQLARGFQGLKGAEAERDDDFIELRLSGNFGVDVVVRGPVRDRGELEATAIRLLREMRAGGEKSDS